jgi:hypothetical protein
MRAAKSATALGGYEALTAAGTAQAPTPWGAAQRAAWEALNKAAV